MAQLSLITGPIIRAGEFLSEICTVTQGRPVRIISPLTWTPAQVTFQVSVDGIHFDDLYDVKNQEIVMECSNGNRAIVLSADVAIAVTHIKFRSGRTNAPIIQPVECIFYTVLDHTVSYTTADPAERLLQGRLP